jgi:hypothetical protein
VAEQLAVLILECLESLLHQLNDFGPLFRHLLIEELRGVGKTLLVRHFGGGIRLLNVKTGPAERS